MRTQRIPDTKGRDLDASLGARLPPSSSRVPVIYREITVCHAYMCSYAYGCGEKSSRPAQVMMRRCMRYLPEWMRVKPGLSDLALDLLARRQVKGKRLSPAATALLARWRPDGPLRKRP